MTRRRACPGCGFENAEEGNACPLCGATAVDEYAIADDTLAEAAPGVEEALREVSSGTEDRHDCAKCHKPFMVVYEAQPGEGKRDVPVACPHCWQTSQVPVGRWAADGEQYRVEKG